VAPAGQRIAAPRHFLVDFRIHAIILSGREETLVARITALAATLLLAAVALNPSSAPAADQCGAHPWCDPSQAPDVRAQELLDALSQSQKVSLLAGNDLIGLLGLPGTHTGSSAGVPGYVPPVNFTDGTAGIRQGSATAVPVEIAVAASFDPALAELDGALLGNEAKLKGNDALFGPTLTIMRTPLAGRTFQGLGEDPLLAARMGVGLIDGLQSQGVIANANIYVANNQEGLGGDGHVPGEGPVGGRLTVNAIVDQRTLREIYLAPFEAAVKQAGVGTVMCAYNRVNGTYNCENGTLLNGVLKREWGFHGFTLSDYAAVHNTIASLQNGLDFEPWPGLAYSPIPVQAALLSGLVTPAQLDDHVRRYLRTLFAFGVFDRAAYVDDDSRVDKTAHAAAAQRIAEGAITLLQNRHATLPLDAGRLKSIAVIGAPANAFVTGSGSSAVTPYSKVTPLAGITQRAGPGVRVSYDDGSDPARAATVAAGADVAIVVAADFQGEGSDRLCLSLECPYVYGDQDGLIAKVAAANPRTTVVLETGGPVLTPWRDQVAAIVEAWYPGEQGGAAIARALFGDVDPSGRLPATFPRSEADLPTAGDLEKYPGVAENEAYKEGVFVGYRWFDERRLQPAFPFGFGLSYASFDYRDLTIARAGADPVATVSATIVNTGARAGAAVPQLYLGLPSTPGVPEPPRQLGGFTKVSLAPGQAARVTLPIAARSLSHWDLAAGAWRITPGCYGVFVGSSSRDLPLRGALPVAGGACPRSRARR
jgi:beta-glucosidase